LGWLSSLAVAVLTAVAGCLGAGFLADVCVGWYRISSREGNAGYFVAFMGLFGLVGGFVIGLVCARIVAGGATPGFLRGLGVALGAALGGLVLIAGAAWLGAEFPPTLDGQALDVEVEVRLPEGASQPVPGGSFYMTITADSGGRRQSLGPLRIEEARQVAGRWVLPGRADLSTTDPGKALGIEVGEGSTQYFRFPLPGQPTRADFAWSAWLTGPTRGDLTPVPSAQAVEVRYRVQGRGQSSD
jgi:hypothetical protein